ncbi:MAG: purine-nucleoside phosphorylase [Pirellulaceae bacterium]
MGISDQQLEPAVAEVASKWSGRPRFGIILGTGAGKVADNIEVEARIPYRDIPGFPVSTVIGHEGQFVCGKLAGQSLIAMQGRFHLYEGYSDAQVHLPIALMRRLGVEILFISNAAGGVNPRFASGDLMVLASHLDLMFRTWQVPDVPLAAGRPLSLADAYDQHLIDQALNHARSEDFVLHRGVYAGLLGPNYETRAEYRFLRKIGGDVVGMSTVPEVVFAAQMGIRVLAFSIVANVANPDLLEPTSGQEVVDAAAVAAPRLCSLVVNAMELESG